MKIKKICAESKKASEIKHKTCATCPKQIFKKKPKLFFKKRAPEAKKGFKNWITNKICVVKLPRPISGKTKSHFDSESRDLPM